MSGFTKLVPEIVQSSIWNESPEVRCTWITLLAIKDEHGNVRGNEITLSRIANVGLDAVREALTKFQQADEHSNTPDHEGRRIEAIPGGWHVLNHALYRGKDYKEYEAERKKEYRAKHRMSGTCPGQVPDTSASVSVSAFDYASQDGGCGGEGRKPAPRKPARYSESFDAAWSAFGRYGSKPRAYDYWKRLTDEDRAAIVVAIPAYLETVEAGRTKKQFEGWINPQNRLWEMDWAAVLVELTRPIKARKVERESWLPTGSGGILGK